WMGRIVETPVVRDGQIVARPMMYLTISYDHRVMDGMSSALFLRKVKEELENPGGLLQEEREGKAT
ncbi:MAG: 2-oxo acid dehydrogenase subunit E2, partial [Nitrospinota bacterium]